MDFIFSPIVESVAPAFDAASALTITYTIPDKVNINDIKHMGIKVIEQQSNQTVVNNDKFPDGIIYMDLVQDTISNRTRTITIDQSSLVEGHWKANTYYKIQLRFGTGSLEETGFNNIETFDDFVNWKKTYLERKYKFSEWSTVLLTKAINPPAITLTNIKNLETSNLIELDNIGNEYSTTPLFEGIYNTDLNEPITHYCFTLYDITNTEKLIEDSGWLVHNSSKDEKYSGNFIDEDISSTGGDTYRFKTTLIYDPNAPVTYKVVYSVRTLNLYEKSAPDYKFSIIETSIDSLPNWLHFDFNPEDEEGLVSLYLRNTEGDNNNNYFQLSGTYVISRTSEKNNFALWEDIKYFNWDGEIFNSNGELIFKDYTIESGVQYQYSITQENYYGIRTKKTIAKKLNDINSEYAEVNFQYSFLYDNGIQLKLKYDNNMNSFKHTTLSNKQDSLGGKYPIISRHGQADYSEFPINGLLSLHSDEAMNFFELRTLGDDIGYYYKNELLIPKRKLKEEKIRHNKDLQGFSFDTNITDDNIYIERMFREKAIDFINDGRYKLFKSPTEGNIIISLINVSMTPNQQLSRMIYSFTSTAYEVMENTYDNLVAYGVQERGEPRHSITATRYFTGQISDLIVGGEQQELTYNNGRNLYSSWENISLRNIITKQIQDVKADAIEDKIYKYELLDIVSICFESFPDANYQDEIRYLDYLIAEFLATPEEERTEELEIQYKENLLTRNRLYSIVQRQREYASSSKIGIKLEYNYSAEDNKFNNATEIYLGYNQVYHLAELIETFPGQRIDVKILPATTITLDDNITKFNYYPPMICNYVATGVIKENTQEITKSIVSASAWGQMAGIFTNDQAFYETQMSLENLNKDNIPMKIYNTLDITSLIDEYVKEQVKKAKGINTDDPNKIIYDEIYNKDEETWEFISKKNNTRYILKILGYDLIDIECNKYNRLIITGTGEDINGYKPVIGPTNRYVLKYSEVDNVRHIALEKPAYCIINFAAQCSIEEKGSAT